MKYLRDNFIFLFLFILLFSPLSAFSGSMGPTYLNPETDNASFQLFYYWDLRQRDSYIQVFNKSSSPVRVHVQIFTANSAITPCEEIDFADEYTSFDTHIYNLRNLVTNSGITSLASLSEGSFGFAVVTVVGPTGFSTITNPVLQGSFRIIDESGYEYRANPAGVRPIGFTTDTFAFSFNSIGGQTFSDVVGIPVKWVSSGFGTPIAGADIVARFDPEILDEDENVISCSPVVFRCTSTGINLGINESIRNSQTNSRMCVSSQNTGVVRLKRPVAGGAPGTTQADFFVGFIGLNDGSNIGSMDSFIAVP